MADEGRRAVMLWLKDDVHAALEAQAAARDLPLATYLRTEVINRLLLDTPKPKRASPARMGDDAFLVQLQASPAYKHIQVSREIARMEAWLLAHPGRKKTQRFIVNWLNKVAPGNDDAIDPLKKAIRESMKGSK